MIALVLFSVLMFAPFIGLEPGFIDDEASRVILEPKRFFVGATMVGWIVDIVFLRSFFRRECRLGWRGWPVAMGCYYLATLVCALAVRWILTASILNDVPVARLGVLTWEAWALLVGPLFIVSAGGIGLGAHLYTRFVDVRRVTAVSLFVKAGLLSGVAVAVVLVAAHWRG